MDKQLTEKYIRVLNEELIAALGCTEPIALAYAGAIVRKEIGAMPDEITALCSGNIIKNVKGVTVPNSGGRERYRNSSYSWCYRWSCRKEIGSSHRNQTGTYR